MNLKVVTITGADDSTNIEDLISISREFPFVEWGILFSRARQGAPRYPSLRWVELFAKAVAECPMRVAAHLCGRLVREFVLDASWTFPEYCRQASIFARVQLNFHGQFHRASPSFQSALVTLCQQHEFIVQCDGVNDLEAEMLCDADLAVPLFDASGGAGILPVNWPAAWETYCGYAGGLGPSNIADQIEKIAVAAAGKSFWIDMERRVRAEDDSFLDLTKVRSVLETVRDFMRAVPALA